ncbi:MAG: allophanate hydrolase [Kineosporiaceae bacterium]
MTVPVVTGSATEAALRSLEAIAGSDRSEVWIALRPAADVLADAAAVDARVAAGEVLPLAGRTLAVKNNIDVAGLRTTAGCPSYGSVPSASAPVVQRLVDAGCVVVGVTNLDQFATGLVGTRSPYGAVRNAWHPERVSGGSSSGSGVAVALGLVDLSLGTDTAGSGRVPAALNGIVGLKPTRGMVPTTGVVPACRSFDCVTVFARELSLASAALAVMAGPDAGDPDSFRPVTSGWSGVSGTAPSPWSPGCGRAPRVAVPRGVDLEAMDADGRAAFARAVSLVAASGADVVEVDLQPFLATARLLYDGAFVAERYAAVGEFVDAHRAEVDPTVGGIISAARDLPAHRLVADTEQLARMRVHTASLLAGVDALVVPTVPAHPTLAEVAAAPVAVNSRLGTYTNFCNLLDYCGVAVPVPGAGEAFGTTVPFGVTVMTPAFGDGVAAGLAGLLAHE